MIKTRPTYPTDLYGTIYIDKIQKAVVVCLIIPKKGQKYKKKRSTRPAAELWKMKCNAPIEHTPILYINVKRNMGTFKLNKVCLPKFNHGHDSIQLW
jgi:hypothetical protein